jgi:hypothetical protein
VHRFGGARCGGSTGARHDKAIHDGAIRRGDPAMAASCLCDARGHRGADRCAARRRCAPPGPSRAYHRGCGPARRPGVSWSDFAKMGSLPADGGTLRMAFGVQNYAECWPRLTTAQPSLEPFTEASSLITRHNPGLGIMPQRVQAVVLPPEPFSRARGTAISARSVRAGEAEHCGFRATPGIEDARRECALQRSAGFRKQRLGRDRQGLRGLPGPRPGR